MKKIFIFLITFLFIAIQAQAQFNTQGNIVESLESFMNTEQASTPSTPATGKWKIYFKTDGDFYKLDDTGTESIVTGAGGGNVSNTGTPLNNQIAVWTNSTTIEGLAGLTYDLTTFALTGNMTLTGTVDGRDIATDGAKLDGIQSGATGITLGTPQATTSGTQFDFTGIPSGTKKITLLFNAVGIDALESILVQLGDSGGFETTGYLGSGSRIVSGIPVITSTSGFVFYVESTTVPVSGSMVLELENSTSNTWVASVSGNRGTTSIGGDGIKALSGELTQIRITPETGNFDEGEINIQYQ